MNKPFTLWTKDIKIERQIEIDYIDLWVLTKYVVNNRIFHSWIRASTWPDGENENNKCFRGTNQYWMNR